MKQLSFRVHWPCLFALINLSILIKLAGCYSFTGGSIPPHLRTLVIQTVEDQSGFGNPEYATILTQKLIEQFENDGHFTLVQSRADAEVAAVITSIRDELLTVQEGEREQDRKVTVVVQAQYRDQVRNKQIWNKRFVQYRVYPVEGGAMVRDQSVREALEAIAEDIVLAVVSHW